MPTALLDDRALISVTGADAETFLQNLVTTDLDALSTGDIRPGALLSPQGKILFDFLISRAGGDGFLIDFRADVAADFLKRLTMYRLRAKVDFSIIDQQLVAVSWGGNSAVSHGDPEAGNWLADRRFQDAEQVRRCYRMQSGTAVGRDAWQAFRIASAIPESGADYALGDAFPHDVLLDQIGGVGFRKGCYVGQEVVSRMHHRGTARRRALIATSGEALPPPGSEILAGGRPIGSLGSVSDRTAIAIVRIDKVKAAVDAGIGIHVEGRTIDLALPDWVTFAFPATESEEA